MMVKVLIEYPDHRKKKYTIQSNVKSEELISLAERDMESDESDVTLELFNATSKKWTPIKDPVALDARNFLRVVEIDVCIRKCNLSTLYD